MSDWLVELRRRADAEIAAGGEEFMGWPDRWYEKPGPKWRCKNGHVSCRYLKSEQRGADVCLACHEPVVLTFPEDKDGSLEPAVARGERDGIRR